MFVTEKTETVSPPQFPDATLVLRTVLTPAEVEEAEDRGIRRINDKLARQFGAVMADRQMEKATRDSGRLNLTKLEAADILGVAEAATEDEVRAAFRAAAKQTHPDTGGGADGFARVRAAYRKLLAGPEEKPPQPTSWRDDGVILDMEWGALQLVVSWEVAGKKLPVSRKQMRRLDLVSRDFLWDKVWVAMQPSMADAADPGN